MIGDVKMIDVILLFGVIGSGKTFQQNKYKDLGYVGMEFAEPLKQMASDITGKDAFSETFKDPAGRALLQKLGSSVRSIDKNFFANALSEKVKNLPPNATVVISDTRYVNEIAALLYLRHNSVVRAKGGIRISGILCNYKSDRYDANNSHESEALAQTMLRKFQSTEDYVVLKEQDLIDLTLTW